MKTIIYYGNINNLDYLKNHFDKLNVLQSFAGISNKEKPIDIKNWHNKFFLDSGAYSVWRRNKIINIDEYISFIKKNINNFNVYVNLDVIGNAEASFKNYMIMREHGLNPMPVWHIHSPISYLYKYAEYTDYIGIGQIVKMNGADRTTLLNRIFKKYNNNNEVGFHGFGIGSVHMIENYPWKSIDATTVHTAARYGEIFYKDGSRLYLTRSMRNAENTNNSLKFKEIKKYIDTYKLNTDAMFEQTPIGTNERLICCIKFFEDLMDKIGDRKKFKTIGFNFLEN